MIRKRSERIDFEDIQPGDRLRVTYQTGTQGGWYPTGKFDVMTRSVASTAKVLCLDRVWLNEGGHPIAHKDWQRMEIYRLPELDT